MGRQLQIGGDHDDRLSQAINLIVEMLNDGKLEWGKIKVEMGKIGQNIEQLRDRVYEIEDWSRKPFKPATVRTYLAVVSKFYNGLCPCCSEALILNPFGGENEILELDHFKGPKWNKVTEGWPICRECHQRLTHGNLRDARRTLGFILV